MAFLGRTSPKSSPVLRIFYVSSVLSSLCIVSRIFRRRHDRHVDLRMEFPCCGSWRIIGRYGSAVNLVAGDCREWIHFASEEGRKIQFRIIAQIALFLFVTLWYPFSFHCDIDGHASVLHFFSCILLMPRCLGGDRSN